MSDNLIEETLKNDDAAFLETAAEQADAKQHTIGKKYNFYIPADDADDEEREAFFRALGVPASADEYKIEMRDNLISNDPEVNERLRQLGFTQKQVQAVYDLASERITPCIKEMAMNYEGLRQLDLLSRHFGGEERWNEISRQLAAWGTKNLPKAVYEPLASSYEGVLALYDMMNSGEPVIGSADNTFVNDDEATLKKLMMSEKYWRDKDPATLRRVSEGFKRLYPDNN